MARSKLNKDKSKIKVGKKVFNLVSKHRTQKAAEKARKRMQNKNRRYRVRRKGGYWRLFSGQK